MRISSQLLLTFIFNSLWQIALIAGLAALGSWLLRDSVARYRHWIWVSALCLAFAVPLLTSLRTLGDTAAPSSTIPAVDFVTETSQPFQSQTAPAFSGTTSLLPSTFQLNQSLGLALLTLYCGFLLYRVLKLVQAWQLTRTIRRLAIELEPNDRVAEVIRTCERQIPGGSPSVKVLRSETLPVPVTIGLFHPVIILPEPLLREGNVDLLTSAIGHEFIHVIRWDYVLNFIYELLFVPISFHPAAALLRRRVKQTRELCCDELVAERILNAEAYARSLVQLASSAPPLRRLSVTTTVGIADADILEARIMSLLKKPNLNTRGKKLLLVAVALLLLVPSVAAAAFALRFEVEPNAQEPSVQELARKEKEQVKQKMEEVEELKAREARTIEELKMNQSKEKEEVKTKVAELEALEQVKARDARVIEEMKEKLASNPEVQKEITRKREMEIEMRAVMHAALVQLAKINMDQANQIASSQQPGKILMSSLGAKGWESPGKLGKDGIVFYHVIIADETDPGVSTHVFVNAIDGSVMKTEKELPRKLRSPEEN